MRIPIEAFLSWQEKNMVTYYKSNVTIEFYKLLYNNKLSTKLRTIICQYCKKQFIPKINFEQGYQKYCCFRCSQQASYIRAKNKKKLK
jgi:hypothetical protein